MSNRKVIKNGVIVEGFTSGSTVLDIQGTQGELFSITDDLTGEIFTVSDISGMPILAVEADGDVLVDGNLKVNNNQVWHAGNSNKSDVNWQANDINAWGWLIANDTLAHRNNVKVLNKAANDWVTWATRNTSGSESVMDLSNVGDILSSGKLYLGTTPIERPRSTLAINGPFSQDYTYNGDVNQWYNNSSVSLLSPHTYLDFSGNSETSYADVKTFRSELRINNVGTGNVLEFHEVKGINVKDINIIAGDGTINVSQLSAFESNGLALYNNVNITDAYGFRYDGLNTGVGTITNKYDIYLGPTSIAQGGSISNNYGIYQADTGATNYFGGNVGIGITSPSEILHVKNSGRNGGVWYTTFLGQNTTGYQNAARIRVHDNQTDIGSDYLGIGNATQLSFSTRTNGGALTQQVFIDSVGNVGIGASTPMAKLHIDMPSSAIPTVLVGRYTGASSIQALGDEFLILDSAGAGNGTLINHYVSDNVGIATGGGNVGIGTNDPTDKLHVLGTAKLELNGEPKLTFKVSGGTNTWELFQSSDSFYINPRTNNGTFNIRDASNNTLLHINTNGYVGIGTVSPTSMLHVIGNANIDESLNVSGTTTLNNTIVNSDINFNGSIDNFITNGNGQISFTTGSDVIGATAINASGGITATTVSLSNLTAGYVPYHTSNGLANSDIYTDGTNIGFGTNIPSATLEVNGTAKVNGSPIWYGGNYAGYGSWTPNFTSTIDCISNGSFQKVRGTAEWDAQIYSSEGFLTNVFAQASALSVSGKYLMFGLNSDPTNNSSFETIDYAFYLSNGSLFAYENGVSYDLSAIYDDTDIMTIHYDGTSVRYYRNNTLLRSVARTTGNKLYFDSSINSGGFKNVGFGSMGPLITNSVHSFTSDIVNITVPPTTGGTDLLLATMADNDYFRLRVGGTSNAGYVELATADDGTEPIYVRQYSGYFSGPLRTLTLLDGNGNTTVPGKLYTGSDIYVGGGNVYVKAGDARVKYGMWGDGDSVYGIGMMSGYNFGGLGTAEYAMSFQMNDNPGRGFWWGDQVQSNDQGAMALTTDGLLTVAKGIRMGYGNNDTVTPSENVLDVYGNVDITGTLTASVKSFVIDHPTKPGKKLQYGVLEGPEHSVYTRGMLDGDDTIILPEEWVNLVHEDSITVTLTPIGNHQKLYVKSVNSSKIKIGHGFRKVKCYYTIFGERKDVGKLITEFDKM